MSRRYLIATARAMAILGLTALTLSGEVGQGYLAAGWSAIILGFLLDRRPVLQATLRHAETAAVVLFVAVMLLDFFVQHLTVFLMITHFLILFQIFKCLGLKERKDGLQMLLFGFFQILASCTLSIDISEGLMLLLFVPLASIGFFWHQVEWEKERSGAILPAHAERPYRWTTALLGLGALPVNLILTLSVFLFFPRLTFNMTFAGLGNRNFGYSRQIDLSQTGQLQESHTPVLWLQFQSETQRQQWNGYLRGDTLETFDGRQWAPAASPRVQQIAPDLNQTFRTALHRDGVPILRAGVTMVIPSGSTFFTTGRAIQISAPLNRLLLNPDGSLHAATPFQKPLHYDVLSEMETSAGPPPGESQPAEDLRLPAFYFSRTQSLAREIAGGGSPADQTLNIEAYLRTHYKYSLQLADDRAGAGINPLEDFLFVRKQGPCSYFASAMAVMLRLQGIPSRIVAGYLRGEWNPPAGQYLIRDSDAHAWVEAYLPGIGWRTFDPSPRDVAPAPWHFSLMVRALQYWEYLELEWNHLVIDYDLYSQVRAFESLQQTGQPLADRLTRWRDRWITRRPSRSGDASTARPEIMRIIFLGGLAAFIGLIMMGLTRRKHMPLHADNEVRSYQKFLERMARAGVPKHDSETGWEYAKRLERSQPAVREMVESVTEHYYLARFSKSLGLFLLSLSILGFPGRQAQADSGSTDVKSLIAALKSSDEDQREHAADALKNLGPAAAPAIPALRKALNDDLPYVRTQSAAALAAIGAPAVPAFIDALGNDSSDVRAIAATSLGHLGAAAEPAIPALVNALKDSDTTVRSNASTALVNLDDKASSAVITLLKEDNAATRLIAVRTLGGMENSTPDATTALMGRFADDNAQVRLAAVKALGHFGGAVVPTLMTGLQSQNAAVREQSCVVLADIGHKSKDAVLPLITLTKDSDASVRGAAASALGKIGSAAQPAVPALQALTKDSDATVVSRAQEALTNITALFEQKGTAASAQAPMEITTVPEPAPRKIPPAEIKRRIAAHKARAQAVARMAASKKMSAAVGAQVKQLENDDDVVRLEASQKLTEMGPKAVDGLIYAVTHSTISVRVAATTILGQIGAPAAPAAPLLTENLRSPQLPLRQPSAISLLQIDSMTAFATLTDLAKQDPDSSVRLNAIQVLGQIGAAGAPAVPGLIDVLKDTDTAISSKASLALTQIGTPEATAAVKAYDHVQTNKQIQDDLKTLRSHGPAIDPKAVEGLVIIGSPAVPAMASALKDPNPAVRGGAASMLNRLGKDAAPATQALIDALDDSDLTVRKQAAESLAKIDNAQSESALRFFPEKEWLKETFQHSKK